MQPVKIMLIAILHVFSQKLLFRFPQIILDGSGGSETIIFFPLNLV